MYGGLFYLNFQVPDGHHRRDSKLAPTSPHFRSPNLQTHGARTGPAPTRSKAHGFQVQTQPITIFSLEALSLLPEVGHAADWAHV